MFCHICDKGLFICTLVSVNIYMQNELNCSLSLELYIILYYVITCTQSLRFPEGFFFAMYCSFFTSGFGAGNFKIK